MAVYLRDSDRVDMKDTPQMTASTKRYFRQFGGSMVLYTAVLLLATVWLRSHHDSPYRLAIALLPVLPVLLAALAAWRFFGDMDELQRRLMTETLSFAFVGTALFVITYGFMESAGFPKLSMWWVWLVMGSLWGGGTCLTSWRYR